MAGYSEAYDFSLFEARYDNTAPAREPSRRQEQKHESNITRLPQQQLEKNARRRLHPIRALVTTVCFAVGLVLATAMVYSQQQLAVLTEQINQASRQLAEAQSVEVQLNMQAAQKMNGSQVEEYVTQNLGMGKITSAQVTYVNVAQEDRGTVLQSTEGGSIVDRALSEIRAFFSNR